MKKLFRPTVPLESYQHVKPPPLALVEVTVTQTWLRSTITGSA